MPTRKGSRGSRGGSTKDMPDVRAILAADIHLQPRPPIARSEEPDWWGAMARPLNEIHLLKNKYAVPVIYAGDIFDRWNAGPELINFAIRQLPSGYAIPGQHDLPNHNYTELHRSAYHTLEEAGVLKCLPPGQHTNIRENSSEHNLFVTGFPWGFEPEPCLLPNVLHIAICHRFVWYTGTGYQGAKDSDLVGNLCKDVTGYDTIVFGDNHKPFEATVGGTTIFNCGSIMRRHSDQDSHRPSVGLLQGDGTVTRHYLDISKDVLSHAPEIDLAASELLDMTSFVEALRSLDHNDALNFTVALDRFLRDNKVAGRVAELVLQAVGG